MVFFGVLSVSCRIYRSSRKKPDVCSLAPLRTLSMPSPYQVLVFAGFAGFAMFAGVCFSIFLVGEIYFASWRSLFFMVEGYVGVSLYMGWRRKPSGDKGAAPPRAQAPSPCRVGLAPFLFDISVCENSCTDCYGSSDSGLARFPAKSVHNETESK